MKRLRFQKQHERQQANVEHHRIIIDYIEQQAYVEAMVPDCDVELDWRCIRELIFEPCFGSSDASCTAFCTLLQTCRKRVSYAP